ncbi:MAG: 2TM domain-containing protein [Bacteroidota bacterium]
MNSADYQKYERAKKDVKALKGFYSHVWVFAFVTIMIFVVRFYLLPMFGIVSDDEGFNKWVDVNTFIVPGIWAIVLIVHGLVVHRRGTQWLRKWEERKMQEFMEEEDTSYH